MHWIALQLEPPAQMPPGSHTATPTTPSTSTPATTLATALSDPVASLADPLAALAWQALQFTPHVVRLHLGADAGRSVGVKRPATSDGKHDLAPAAGDVLLMEVSASERLFGGRQALWQKMFKENSSFVHISHAQAATSLIALAKLQLHTEQAPVQITRVADLPLPTLAAARPHLATLARVGCTTWGQLRALPRGGVVRRFGAELLDALDRAFGLKPDLYPWLTLPEVFDEKIELHAQVETAPALMFGAQRLLKQLHLWLQLRNVGVTTLEFGWTMDARRSLEKLANQSDSSKGALTLRTAEATQDIGHLQRLLSENLARQSLPAPALYVHLRTLHTEALATQSAPLLLEDLQKGDSLHQMLERLSARLGPEALQGLQTQADHRPEDVQFYDFKLNKILKYSKNAILNVSISAIIERKIPQNNSNVNSKLKKYENLRPDALYPTWLLHPPLALAVLHHTPHYHGPLTLLAGPQRLETGWFDTPALRDYFIAQSEQAGLLWVFRQRLGGPAQWFLQGLFD